MKSRIWQAFSLLYRYPAFGRLWVGRLVSLFGDAFALIALPWFGLLELWMLFLLTFLAGMLVPVTEVGARSILPDLVEDKDLDAANMLW